MPIPCCSQMGSEVRPDPRGCICSSRLLDKNQNNDSKSKGSQLSPAESAQLSLAGKGSQAAFSLLCCSLHSSLLVVLLQISEAQVERGRSGWSLGLWIYNLYPSSSWLRCYFRRNRKEWVTQAPLYKLVSIYSCREAIVICHIQSTKGPKGVLGYPSGTGLPVLQCLYT